MATTVGTRPLTKTGVGGGPKPRGPNGNGGPKRNGHKRRFPDFQSSANRYRIGMWVALASILMMFTALSSAYIVRAASASDWRQLVRQGVYVASNPHSSFFYLLTAAHGVHLLGGLATLAYLSLRRRASEDNPLALAKSLAGADAVTLYWHFMDFLWLYLFVLLFFVR